MSMYPIATSGNISNGTGNFTFSSIPQTYTHLQVRVILRCATATNQLPLFVQFNGDGSNNYTEHGLQGNGSSASSGSQGLGTSIGWYSFAGSSTTSGVFGVGILDILDYANTNKYKTAKGLSGYDNNGDGDVNLTSGLWLSTSAINSITFSPYGGFNTNYSRIDLYGITTA